MTTSIEKSIAFPTDEPATEAKLANMTLELSPIGGESV